ncbi:uncharacterized protein LOC124885835 [Capsicum annuum]|uniref:uncharacterized protein LOC124885835 n=1 Tax=Capsicum annuum TaxID=4072 RepID=UPI001FB0D9A0|nr:uncharacterized protein LOC124885835 [Capsicum annuum]
MLKQLTINVPLVEALEQMPRYAKFMKDLVTKKQAVSCELEVDLHLCSVISIRTLVQKKPYPGAVSIPCTIGTMEFTKALCDLGASVNLMSLTIYRKLGLGNLTPTNMRLVMVDRINDEVVQFDIAKSMKQNKNMSVLSVVDVYYEEEQEVPIAEQLVIEPLVVVMMNYDSEALVSMKRLFVP